jgi:hypothetical protein
MRWLLSTEEGCLPGDIPASSVTIMHIGADVRRLCRPLKTKDCIAIGQSYSYCGNGSAEQGLSGTSGRSRARQQGDSNVKDGR